MILSVLTGKEMRSAAGCDAQEQPDIVDQMELEEVWESCRA